MELFSGELLKEYKIKGINTKDKEFNNFLFSLGCYPGETITIVSRRKSSCIVVIKDVRYNIDKNLAKDIIV